MNEFVKPIKRGIIVCLVIAVVFGITWYVNYAWGRPNQERMEQELQQSQRHLQTVADYFGTLEYSYISVDKTNIKDGVMFTGAVTGVQKIEDVSVCESLQWLLNQRKFLVIGKNQNTVYFQKWRFMEKDRGIAVSCAKEQVLFVEFLVQSAPLSEEDWYYYEADYEKYKNTK